MLSVLSDIFDSLRSPAASDPPRREHTLQLATAVLLVEVVRADGQIDEAERQAVIDALRGRFTLSPAELADLYALAREKSEHTHDLYGFTAELNRSLDAAGRLQVFEMLWTVAYANGRADAHEAHLLRRLADLLHLGHAEAIGAKLRAEAASRSAG